MRNKTDKLLKEQIKELKELVKLKDARIIELEKKILEQAISKPKEIECPHATLLISPMGTRTCASCGENLGVNNRIGRLFT